MADIRAAKKKNGTEPLKVNTPEPGTAPIMDVDNAGETVNVTDKFDGDDIVASYMDFLKENDISEEDVREVFDALITTGNVTWQFNLFGKIPVTFKVRQAWVDDYILDVIDADSTENERVSVARYNNMIATCNLAASLTEYNGQAFVVDSRESLDKAREFVRNLSYIIQNALVKKLAVFDRIIAVATSDWSVRNFTEPRKEK